MSKGSRSRKKKERERRHAGAKLAERPSASELSESSPARKPAHEAAHEDAFFARGEESSSFPPSSVDAHEPEVDETVQRRRRPEVIERRARSRRLVSWIVGAAAVLTALVSVKALLTRSRPITADTSMSAPHQVVASIAIPAATDTTQTAEPTPAPTAAAEPTAQPAPAEPAAVEAAPAVEAQPSSEPSAAPAPSKADVRRLIDRGRMRDGIAAARAAIDSDSSDAETYLLLGAALQELGQWKESMAVFSQCVEQATQGPKNECKALRGR